MARPHRPHRDCRGIGAVLLALRLTVPSVRRGPSALWWRFSRVVDTSTRACLTVLFALVFVPISFVWRYSARIQTVRRDTHPAYYDIVEAFDRRTGCPVLVNTSFNVRGEPIVCSPEDAYRCFIRTDMDVLVLESFILEKLGQKPLAGDESRREEFVLGLIPFQLDSEACRIERSRVAVAARGRTRWRICCRV